MEKKMKWSLRIPLMFMMFGLVSGIFQYYRNFFPSTGDGFLRGLLYIVTMGMIIISLEKSGLNEVKVYIPLGILMINGGFLADYYFGR
jgi:hypothetical protein